MSASLGRTCEHGLPASHSRMCYEEEYGESYAELVGEDWTDDDMEEEE